MKKRQTSIQYDYIVHNISEDNSPAYKALIPAFNGVVFGASLAELEKGVALAVEEEIKHRRKHKKSIPKPDQMQHYSGKLVLRIDPVLHERLALEAKSKEKSLNSYIKEKILH